MIQDGFQRKIDYIRLSLTDTCNFQCFYCRPRFQETSFSPSNEYLTAFDIEFMFQVLAQMGVRKVKLTGGEPLLRKDMCDILQKISAISQIKDISLTTNGYFLENIAYALKESGLKRVNISLDSLNADTFQKITQTPTFHRVWRGILKAIEVGLDPVKLNIVLMKGVNDQEVEDFVELTQKYPLSVRFIEFMPTRQTVQDQKKYAVSNEAVLNALKRKYDLFPEINTSHTGPSRNYVLKNGLGSIGFISPITHNFCDQCNRVRISAKGKLRLCLLGQNEIELLQIIRQRDANQFEKVFMQSMFFKPKAHELNMRAPWVESFVTIGG